MEREHCLAGKVVATSIIHGGRAPNCYSRAFAEKVGFEVTTQPDPSDPHICIYCLLLGGCCVYSSKINTT